MLRNFDIKSIIFSLPAILIALTFHECAHAFAAHKLGDDTAKNAGRLSLNPLRHIDPIGFVMLIVARFGWAKPVPVNPRNFKKPKRDEVIVSLAGPLSNILMAVFFALLMRLPIWIYSHIDDAALTMYPYFTSFITILQYCIIINLTLFIFNLFPVPPLDGSHLLLVLLPRRFARFIYKIMPYSNIVFILIMVTGAGTFLITTPAAFLFDFLIKYVVGI